jgi:hypothetical protein
LNQANLQKAKVSFGNHWFTLAKILVFDFKNNSILYENETIVRKSISLPDPYGKPLSLTFSVGAKKITSGMEQNGPSRPFRWVN